MKKVLKHEMVPKHEILPEKGAAELLEKYNITRSQLPNVLESDPALKGLKIKNGDIIKITRESSITGTSYAYRLVTTV